MSKIPVTNIRGSKGDTGDQGVQGIQGPQGERGLPGVNAVPADEAVAAYIAAPDSETNAGLRAAIQAITNALVSAALADDPDFEAAMAALAEEAILAVDVPIATDFTIRDLIISAVSGVHTWLQASKFIDPVTGIAGPTDAAIRAMQQAGVTFSRGGVKDLIVASLSGVPTWLQASKFFDPVTGIAGPTDAAVAAMSRSGIPVVVPGAPPDGLDLARGESRIYLNGGEPILAIGD